MTWRPLPRPSGEDRPHELAKSLDQVARSIGAPPADALAIVFSRWEDVVGAGIAAHSRPISLRQSTLVVSVDHPAWATQLRYLGSSILGRITEAVGHEVASRLEVRVGSQ
jgi:predicted nucleic acid-binding Zn ribbon protein